MNPLLAAVIALPLTYGLLSAVEVLLPGSRIAELLLERGPMQYVIVGVSLWGLAILAGKGLKVAAQTRQARRDFAGLCERGRLDACSKAVSAYARTAKTMLEDRCIRAYRCWEATGDREDVSETLRTRAEVDAAVAESGFALVRVLVWAVPVLGFLGTVIGISTAVGGFSSVLKGVNELDELKSALGMVTSGLSVAFDTTFLALLMSLGLMLLASGVERSTDGLLTDVDTSATGCMESVMGRTCVSPLRRSDGADVLERLANKLPSLEMWQAEIRQAIERATSQAASFLDDAAQGIAAAQREHLSTQREEQRAMLAAQQQGVDGLLSMLEAATRQVSSVTERAVTDCLDAHAELQRAQNGIASAVTQASEVFRRHTDALRQRAEELRGLDERTREILAAQQNLLIALKSLEQARVAAGCGRYRLQARLQGMRPVIDVVPAP